MPFALPGQTIIGRLGRRIVVGGGTPAPTPAPSFTTQPSISPTSGTAGQTFTGSDGTITNGGVSSRRWLLNGMSISTGTTAVPASAGSLVYEVTATGAGGTTVATSSAVTVTAAASASAFVLEDGASFFLLEDGSSRLLMEA